MSRLRASDSGRSGAAGACTQGLGVQRLHPPPAGLRDQAGCRRGRGHASPRRPTRSACRPRLDFARLPRGRPRRAPPPIRSMTTRLSRVSSRCAHRSSPRTSSADTGARVLDLRRPGAAHQIGRGELLAALVVGIDQFVVGVGHQWWCTSRSGRPVPGMSTVNGVHAGQLGADQPLGVGVRAAEQEERRLLRAAQRAGDRGAVAESMRSVTWLRRPLSMIRSN